MKTLNSGMKAPATGIYEVTHGPHRLVHQVTIAEGEILPKCLKCGTAVSYQLVKISTETSSWARTPFTYPLVPFDSESDNDVTDLGTTVVA